MALIQKSSFILSNDETLFVDDENEINIRPGLRKIYSEGTQKLITKLRPLFSSEMR